MLAIKCAVEHDLKYRNDHGFDIAVVDTKIGPALALGCGDHAIAKSAFGMTITVHPGYGYA